MDDSLRTRLTEVNRLPVDARAIPKEVWKKAHRIGLIRALHLALYNRGGGEIVDDISNVRMDKTAFSVASRSDESDERDYWLGKSLRERLEAVELLRQLNYGCDPATARLQKVLEIVNLV